MIIAEDSAEPTNLKEISSTHPASPTCVAEKMSKPDRFSTENETIEKIKTSGKRRGGRGKGKGKKNKSTAGN